MALSGGWNIETFAQEFAAYQTPEVLVLILCEALAALERQHRCNTARNNDELMASAIQIDAAGDILLSETGPADARVLLKLFSKFLPEETRIHPGLRDVFARVNSKATQVWTVRGLFLDYLAELGLAGPGFTLIKYLQDPKAYVRAATVAIVDSSCERIRRLNRWGRRRRAIAELQFLLEISPVNRQALDLWRDVKQGRAHQLVLTFYWVLAAGICILCSSVIVEKLQLPMLIAGPKRLEIEPVAPAGETVRGGSTRAPAEVVELEEISRNTEPRPGLKRGAVELDFDGSTLTYFDGAPGSVPAHGNRETIWLREGPHEVTVVKVGQPPVMAHLNVQLDRVILLTDHSRPH